MMVEEVLMRTQYVIVLPILLLSFAVCTRPLSAQDRVSFVRQVKPILDSKCVACHACYDAPGQLDLTSVRGIERGAIKFDPYMPRMAPTASTFLLHSPNTTEDWRKLGFFSVIEGGRDSIMGKMLDLGRKHPVQPNTQFFKSIELDSLKRKNVLPDTSEIDGYLKAHPTEGMPLAVTGLTETEHATLMTQN
jgi:hypothetical protein